jgi:hypothetical protein
VRWKSRSCDLQYFGKVLIGHLLRKTKFNMLTPRWTVYIGEVRQRAKHVRSQQLSRIQSLKKQCAQFIFAIFLRHGEESTKMTYPPPNLTAGFAAAGSKLDLLNEVVLRRDALLWKDMAAPSDAPKAIPSMPRRIVVCFEIKCFSGAQKKSG